jgi:hypothetical protein
MIGEPVSLETVALFLGAALASPPRQEPSGRGDLGWPVSATSPFARLLRALLPITAGHVSLQLASERIWCAAPGARTGFVPVLQLQLLVSPWKSIAQANCAPDLPVPEDGRVLVGRRTLRAAAAFLSWYERCLRRCVREAAERVRAAERTPPAVARQLMPHDLWTRG